MTTNNRGWRRALWTAAKLILVAAAVFFVGKVLVDNWPDVRAGWRPPRAGLLVAAALALLGSYLYLYKVSLVVLRRVGNRLSFRAGLRPFFYSLLGRYVPGRVAVALGKIYLYEKRGVPRSAAALAVTYENVFAAVGGVAVALALAAALLTGAFSWTAFGLAAAGALALVMLIQPAVLQRLLAWPLKKMRLGVISAEMLIGRRWSAAFALAYAAYCISLGVFFAFFAAAFVPLGAAAAAQVGAAYVAAAVLGYVAVFAPSGLGVREGLLIIMLQRYMPPGDAAFLAVASRIVAVAAELLLAAAAAGAGSKTEARATRDGPSAKDIQTQ
ncbi:MAG: lysylphosphatidylglycerol synthase domain-containing protein [bacterium]